MMIQNILARGKAKLVIIKSPNNTPAPQHLDQNILIFWSNIFFKFFVLRSSLLSWNPQSIQRLELIGAPSPAVWPGAGISIRLSPRPRVAVEEYLSHAATTQCCNPASFNIREAAMLSTTGCTAIKTLNLACWHALSDR